VRDMIEGRIEIRWRCFGAASGGRTSIAPMESVSCRFFDVPDDQDSQDNQGPSTN
jgi:hypothetical protein